MRVYTYAKCGSCRKAADWLRARGIAFEELPIRETPPSVTELETMLAAYDGEIRRLFNTSGMDYRELGLKDRIGALSKDEAFGLLRGNGNLVKRPFLVGDSVGLVGFRVPEWERALLSSDP